MGGMGSRSLRTVVCLRSMMTTCFGGGVEDDGVL
jgi:hypothetical protein